MKKKSIVILIGKGVLFYTMLLAVIVYVSAVDSIMDMGLTAFLAATTFVAMLIYLSAKFLTNKDFIFFCGYKTFYKLLNR